MRAIELVVQTLTKYSAEKGIETCIKEDKPFVPEQDFNFYYRSVIGVLENDLLLDFLLNHYLKTNKLKKWDESIIKLGMYLLLFSKQKPHAIIHEIVQVVKRKKRYLSGVVNALLRNIQRESLKALESLDPVKKAQIKLSIHPELFCMLYKSYSIDEIESMVHLDQKTYLTILGDSTNVLKKLEQEGITIIFDDTVEEYYVYDTSDILASKTFCEQKIYLQSLPSKRVVEIPLDDIETVCDCCSSPGGKSFSLLSKKPSVAIDAWDVTAYKIRRLRENIERLKVSQIQTAVVDMKHLPFDHLQYDLVVVDVPCSATGLMHKIPEVKLQRNKKSIQQLIQLQRNILSNAFKLCKNNGMILYSTCSVLPCENEENVEWFLREFPVKKLNFTQHFYKQGVFKTLSFRDQVDGFFGTVLIKEDI